MEAAKSIDLQLPKLLSNQHAATLKSVRSPGLSMRVAVPTHSSCTLLFPMAAQRVEHSERVIPKTGPPPKASNCSALEERECV